MTLTANFDSVTGLNHFAIDTSSDGTFYSAGSFFDIVITTGTVDSVSVVGACVGQFTIRKTSSLKPATAGRTIAVDSSGIADANVVNWKGSTAPAMTGDAYARLGAPAGASVSADIAGVQTHGDSAWSTATGFSTLDAAGVRTAIGLASANLDTQLGDLPTASDNADAVWDEALSGHSTSGSTGEALSAAGSAGDPWNTTLPGSYGSGTAGKIIGDNLNASVSSVKAKTDNLPSSPAATSDVTTAAASLQSHGDSNWSTATGFSTLDAAGVRTAVGLASADLDTQLDALDHLDVDVSTRLADSDYNPDSLADIADAVWDEDLTGHTTTDTAGKVLSDAGSAGDPWSTSLPGSYSAGTAGKILGDNLDAAVSTRLATSGYTAPANADISSIKTKTDNLPSDPADASDVSDALSALQSHGDSTWSTATGFSTLTQANIRTAVGLASANLDTQLTGINTNVDDVETYGDTHWSTATGFAATGDAMTLTSGERTAIADAFLDRDMSTGTDSGSSTVRTVRQALRFLRNKWTITTGTLSVKKEDDSTESWAATVGGTAGADPVTSVDPDGP